MAIASNEAYYDLKPQDLQYYQPEYYKFTDSKDVGINPTEEPAAAAKPVSEEIIKPNDTDHGETNTGKAMKRDATNNFGYYDKPGIIGMAGMLPGALGLAGKAVNLGINASNNAAVEGARGMLGLKEQDTWGDLKGTLKDNHGIVSKNSEINGKNYQIGFEAMNNGVTNLTPNEANTRANTLGGITEDTAGATPAHDYGGLSGLFDSVGSFFDSISGKETRNLQQNQEDVNTNQHMSIMGKEAFPAAPNPQAGDTKTTTPMTDAKKTAGPWGAAGNVSDGGKTGYGHDGKSSQSVGPSGGGKSWGGPR